MGNSYKLTNHLSPTDDDDLVRLNDLTQHHHHKTAIYLKNTEIATSMLSTMSFNVPIKIEFF